MARVKGAMMTRKRRKKIIKLAKGYWGNKKNNGKTAVKEKTAEYNNRCEPAKDRNCSRQM